MLPSLLAREVQTGLKNFLTVGFEPSDALFAGVMERFTEQESRWMKGPFVQLGLPFRVGGKGKHFFKGFETEHPGYVHQEEAWQRLASNHQGVPTLVATGNGSGLQLGNLGFVEGDRPGSNLTYVEAADLATLACLQHRLNELNEGIKIEIC